MGDAGPIRRFRLATAGASLVVTGPALGLQLTPADVAGDSDVVAIHQEFYGVPWDAFEANAAPPPEWSARMRELAASAAGKPIFLSISPLNGKRQSLAARTTIENGAVKSQDDWSANCYDFGTAPDAGSKREAYLHYVTYMIGVFHPAYLNIAIEVNLFFEKCRAAAPALVDLVNLAYAEAKRAAPDAAVFPSIQIDHLYGYSKDSCPDQAKRDACFDSAYAAIANLRRDRFAMSSYPFLNGVTGASELPADWFSRGAARGGETPLIAETGWLSTRLVAKARDGSCPVVFDFDETASAAYLSRVLSDAGKTGMDLVTWWSDRDLVPSALMTDCPCDFDATWCTVLDVFRGPSSGGTDDRQFFGEVLLKAFGTMGLRDYTGTPKASLWQPWQATREVPLAR